MAKTKHRSVSTNATSNTSATKTVGRSFSQEFNPDYTFVKQDLKRIAILAGSFVVILIVLSFILN
jgi:hypothetical protein